MSKAENELIHILAKEYIELANAETVDESKIVAIEALLKEYSVEKFPLVNDFSSLSPSDKGKLFQHSEKDVKYDEKAKEIQVELKYPGFKKDEEWIFYPSVLIVLPPFWTNIDVQVAKPSAKPQEVKKEEPRKESPKPEEPKVETPKVEEAKVEKPKVEKPKKVQEKTAEPEEQLVIRVEEDAPALVDDMEYEEAIINANSQQITDIQEIDIPNPAVDLLNQLIDTCPEEIKASLDSILGEATEGKEVDSLLNAINVCDQKLRTLYEAKGAFKEALENIFTFIEAEGVYVFPTLEHKHIQELDQTKVKGHVKLKRQSSTQKRGMILDIRQRGYIKNGKFLADAKLIVSSGK